jgi:hypothetical protein
MATMTPAAIARSPRSTILEALGQQAQTAASRAREAEREAAKLDGLIRAVYASDAGLSLSAIADAVGKSKSRVQQVVTEEAAS